MICWGYSIRFIDVLILHTFWNKHTQQRMIKVTKTIWLCLMYFYSNISRLGKKLIHFCIINRMWISSPIVSIRTWFNKWKQFTRVRPWKQLLWHRNKSNIKRQRQESYSRPIYVCEILSPNMTTPICKVIRGIYELKIKFCFYNVSEIFCSFVDNFNQTRDSRWHIFVAQER